MMTRAPSGRPSAAAAARRAARTLVLALALLPLVAAPSRGDDDELPPPATDSTPSHYLVPASATPFRAGESLRFSVQYGFIHAGSAWLEVPEVVDWNGHPSWRLVARAESNAFFSRMYKVRNRIESIWDRDGHFSWRYFEDRHEGGYTANDTMVFDTTSRSVRYKNGKTYDLPGPVQDALSAFYQTRFLALPLGGSVTFDYHASRKTALMEVKVLGRETVKTPAGRFDCLMIEPLLKAGGIFKNNGRLVVWITNDERRMPVLMRSKVAIGSISVVLQEFKTGT